MGRNRLNILRAKPIPFGADYHDLRTPPLSYFQERSMGVGRSALLFTRYFSRYLLFRTLIFDRRRSLPPCLFPRGPTPPLTLLLYSATI